MWPEEFKWKLALNQEDSFSHTITLIPENESLTKWTVLGQMMAIKNNFKANNIDQVVSTFTQASLQESPKAKYLVLEKDETTKNFWAIFKVETPNYPNDPIPESQLWYAIQGNSTLYVNFVAIKEKTLSKAFVEKWIKVFKSSHLINK
ncbi:hypothetical protein SAE01_36130 [Segetibacter aerophilus]|uniref:Uncharacterized protein n=1 Tax=Segetibacter aerophilus TaxID=670293 RepID=A0A512BH25_9BACT|nr:hypothetical protein SAE01_36130 [Segetibacter aerophilus]